MLLLQEDQCRAHFAGLPGEGVKLRGTAVSCGTPAGPNNVLSPPHDVTAPLAAMTHQALDSREPIVLHGRLAGSPVTVLIDSGAAINAVSERFLDKHGLKTSGLAPCAVAFADGSRHQPRGNSGLYL